MSRVPHQFTPKMKTCIVCGHILPHYILICDMCGSIQRTATGDGLPIPPDQLETCECCGKQMLKEPSLHERVLCPECETAAQSGTVGPRRASRKKLTAATFGSFTAAAIAATVWALVGGGSATVPMVILGICGLFLIISTGSFAVGFISRKRGWPLFVPKPRELKRKKKRGVQRGGPQTPSPR
jgi:hypothetical protein